MSAFIIAVVVICSACGSAPAFSDQDTSRGIKPSSDANVTENDDAYSTIKAKRNSKDVAETYVSADDVVRKADERYLEYLEEPNGRKARCVFDGEAETCAFVPAPDGSFKIMTVSGGGYDFEKVRPGLVDVTFYGAKPNPLGNFTWNNEDKACWDGADQQICIY